MAYDHRGLRQQFIDLVSDNTGLSIGDISKVYGELMMYDLIDYDLEKEVFSELFGDDE